LFNVLLTPTCPVPGESGWAGFDPTGPQLLLPGQTSVATWKEFDVAVRSPRVAVSVYVPSGALSNGFASGKVQNVEPVTAEPKEKSASVPALPLATWSTGVPFTLTCLVPWTTATLSAGVVVVPFCQAGLGGCVTNTSVRFGLVPCAKGMANSATALTA